MEWSEEWNARECREQQDHTLEIQHSWEGGDKDDVY
jgi:hypothetical protein